MAKIKVELDDILDVASAIRELSEEVARARALDSEGSRRISRRERRRIVTLALKLAFKLISDLAD